MEKFNIFAGDLSFFCTEDDLVRLFSPFGEVQGAIIRRGKQGDTLHYGFVKMHDVDAKNAVSQLQGQYFMGRRVKLNLETGEDGPKIKGKQASYPQVHVSFLSTSIRSQVNEDLLTRMFSRFGDVMDCVIKQYNLSVNPHRQSGYGFVYYRTEEEATGAIHAVKNSTIDGIKFDCGFSREYQPSHRAMASTLSVPREERYPPGSLSVSQQHSVAFGQEGSYLGGGGGYYPPQNYAPPSYYPPANRPLQPAATYQMGNVQHHSQPLFSMNFVHHAPQHYPTLLANTSGGSPVSHSSSGGDPSHNSGSSPVYTANYGMQQPQAPQQPQSAPLPPMYPSSYATYPFPSAAGQPSSSNHPYFSSQPYPFN